MTRCAPFRLTIACRRAVAPCWACWHSRAARDRPRPRRANRCRRSGSRIEDRPDGAGDGGARPRRRAAVSRRRPGCDAGRRRRPGAVRSIGGARGSRAFRSGWSCRRRPHRRRPNLGAPALRRLLDRHASALTILEVTIDDQPAPLAGFAVAARVHRGPRRWPGPRPDSRSAAGGWRSMPDGRRSTRASSDAVRRSARACRTGPRPSGRSGRGSRGSTPVRRLAVTTAAGRAADDAARDVIDACCVSSAPRSPSSAPWPAPRPGVGAEDARSPARRCSVTRSR